MWHCTLSHPFIKLVLVCCFWHHLQRDNLNTFSTYWYFASHFFQLVEINANMQDLHVYFMDIYATFDTFIPRMDILSVVFPQCVYGLKFTY